MTHWYGWLALAVALFHVAYDTVVLVMHPWVTARRPIRETFWSRSTCVWLAMWVTISVMLVTS